MIRILILDDDSHGGTELADDLRQRQFDVRTARSTSLDRIVSSLTSPWDTWRPGAILIDPDGHPERLAVLRAATEAVLVAVSHSGLDRDIIPALSQGADGYLIKPVSAAVVTAWLGSALRHRPGPESATRVIGGLRVEPAQRTVTLDGRGLLLTRTEFDLLACLSERPGRVYPWAGLSRRVGRDLATIAAILYRVRTKLGESARRPGYLYTVRGRGVRLCAPE
ncbi:DNA-binding response OmpR family regulator [Stackebrandtia endophytica]|uniref:DNA-binding response OmpR family regulator n=1 Tax=Stackebrandtia endophytica TaxID=1496996 RepID=A0A543ATY3_9ACTN|nr:response regulator transcription factor [Stackebrandtia endophytica]TQL76050.1 DNA-binding response OmpR family regulator [Stackebrandtia endophytica]